MGDRIDAFMDDILAGPDALADALATHARAIRDLPPDALARPRWRLIGMGSSRFAALDAAGRMRADGLDAVAEIASTSEPSPEGADTLAVLISSSGRTAEVLAAAERHRGRSFVVALTGGRDSPLADRSDAVLALAGARPETAGIACLSYRSTVVGLALLADEALGRTPGLGLAAAIPVLSTLIRGRGAWLGAAADVLDGGREVVVLGDGARLGVAEQAALLLREAPRIPAHAFDTAEWLHVGLYTLFPGDPVLLLAGSAADEEVTATIHGRGGRVVAIGPVPEGASVDGHVPLPEATAASPVMRSLAESVVADLLAAELWRRTDAQVTG